MNPRNPKDDQTKNDFVSSGSSYGLINSNFFNPLFNSIKGALIAGTSSATILFPIDKLVVYQQLPIDILKKMGMPTKPAILDVLKNNFSKGYLPTVSNAIGRNFVLLTTQPMVKSTLDEHNPDGSINQALSGALAGGCAAIINNPTSVIRNNSYIGLTPKELIQLPLKQFYQGTSATLLRESIQWSAYYTCLSYLSQIIDSPTVTGIISGMTGALFATPFAVIATNQKIDKPARSITQTAFSLFSKEGSRFFYKSLLLAFVRMGIQGGIINDVIKYLDTSGEKEPTPSPSMRKTS